MECATVFAHLSIVATPKAFDVGRYHSKPVSIVTCLEQGCAVGPKRFVQG
jgi:hypothetical protein